MTDVIDLAPQVESIKTSASVDWDHRGRVTCCRFFGGQVCQFRYDSNGSMYAFTYGRLAWSTRNGFIWSATDNARAYVLNGYISVGTDGTVRIEKQDVTRILKLDGRIIDEYANGTVLESVHSAGEWAASDLLATVESRCALGSTVSHPAPGATVCEPLRGIETFRGKGSQTRRGIAGGIRLSRMRLQENLPSHRSREKVATKCSAIVAEALLKVLEAVKGQDSIVIAPLVDRLAKNALDQRRIDDARALHERALRLRVEQLGRFHTELSINLHGLGRIYHEWGRYFEAEQYYCEAIGLAEKGLQKARFMACVGAIPRSHTTIYSNRLLSVMHCLASLYHEQRKRQLCERVRNDAVGICATFEPEQQQAAAPIVDSLNAMLLQMDSERAAGQRGDLNRMPSALA